MAIEWHEARAANRPLAAEEVALGRNGDLSISPPLTKQLGGVGARVHLGYDAAADTLVLLPGAGPGTLAVSQRSTNRATSACLHSSKALRRWGLLERAGRYPTRWTGTQLEIDLSGRPRAATPPPPAAEADDHPGRGRSRKLEARRDVEKTAALDAALEHEDRVVGAHPGRPHICQFCRFWRKAPGRGNHKYRCRCETHGAPHTHLATGAAESCIFWRPPTEKGES